MVPVCVKRAFQFKTGRDPHLPLTVSEDEGCIVADVSDQRHRLLVVSLRLPTEAGDDVTAQGDAWPP